MFVQVGFVARTCELLIHASAVPILLGEFGTSSVIIIGIITIITTIDSCAFRAGILAEARETSWTRLLARICRQPVIALDLELAVFDMELLDQFFKHVIRLRHQLLRFLLRHRLA